MYKRSFLNAIRIFAVLSSILLTVVTSLRIFNIIYEGSILTLDNFIAIFENLIAIFLALLIVIYPQKLEFLAIVSFMYSFNCLILDSNNPIGILMYSLGVIVLYIRGFFINSKKKKFSIMLITYVLLLFCEFRFGLEIFINSILNKLGYTLVLAVIIFLLMYKHDTDSKNNSSTKILNLSLYQDLVINDVVLLQKVLENKQYKVIVSEVLRSEGTIRNRLNKVYDIIGVMDRMGFISTYMGYEIVFKDEEKKESLPKAKNLP